MHGVNETSLNVLREIVAQQRYPLLFATISGAHLYGFPSANSDFDLRGVHILPAKIALALNPEPLTIELSRSVHGIELDLVTHDVKKFFLMLLKKNGYVLEQLYSPLIIHTSEEHAELKAIAKGCITRFHFHHYHGFADKQWQMFQQEPRLKTLLYIFRVLLTGIHLMRTGEVLANLEQLNEMFRLPYILQLIEQKKHGSEKSVVSNPEMQLYEKEFIRLMNELKTASDQSHLPVHSTALKGLDDLLVRIRTKVM